MKINLNDMVTFIITQHGIDVLAATERRIQVQEGVYLRSWRHDPASNQCTAPLWSVMCEFGPFMLMGFTTLLIEGNELELPEKKGVEQ